MSRRDPNVSNAAPARGSKLADVNIAIIHMTLSWVWFKSKASAKCGTAMFMPVVCPTFDDR